jgi:Fe-S cluster assembly protein SufD
MALAQARQDLTEARLGVLGVPAGEASWATDARNAALSRVRAAGLPTRRDEYWKYTDPASLTQADTRVRHCSTGRTRHRFTGISTG